jgi:hypothetical protein
MPGTAIRADQNPPSNGGTQTAPPKLKGARRGELEVIEVRVNKQNSHAALHPKTEIPVAEAATGISAPKPFPPDVDQRSWTTR